MARLIFAPLNAFLNTNKQAPDQKEEVAEKEKRCA